MTLGSLDNEVIFKKAFTDKLVFTAFVRDILNIDVEVDKIETEKRFNPKIGYIDFELDIFAETLDKRIVIEIQRIEYDHNFDRFLHYFLMVITEQQKRSKDYGIDQVVYVIVVLTAPYTISEKNGKPIKDEVLLLKLNPRTLQGKERELYGHQFICLNPNHPDDDTPQRIRDWLDLIYQSIHNSERPVINRNNAGILRAADLISFENLTPEERALSKNKEAAKITIAKIEKAQALEIARRVEEVTAEVTREVTAEVTREVTAEVTKEVTAEVTREVTAEVTREVTAEVTREVTAEVTREVTAEVTREVTAEVTREVTAEVTEEVTAEVTEEIAKKAIGAGADDEFVVVITKLPIERVIQIRKSLKA